VINVKDWGAKGNNSTDDRRAIQAAINYAQHRVINGQTLSGGTVFFPPGTYLISSPGLQVGSDRYANAGVQLVGTGHGSARINNFPGNAATYTISNGGLTYDNLVRIEGLGVDGTILLQGVNQSVVNCSINSIDASQAHSAYIANIRGRSGGPGIGVALGNG